MVILPPSSDILELLQAVRADVDADEPRLHLAAWLEEQGDPRGEFVRVQVEAARLHPFDPRREELDARAERLRRDHEAEWLGGLADFASAWEFDRGLVRLEMQTRQLSGRGLAAVMQSPGYAWVIALKLTDLDKESVAGFAVKGLVFPPLLSIPNVEPAFVRSIAGCRALVDVTHLELCEGEVGAGGVSTLVRSKNLANLVHLDLRKNNIDNKAVQSLVKGCQLGKLTSLSLRENHIRYEGIRPLAESPFLGQLTALDLSHNYLAEKGGKVLARSPYLGRLTTLRLESCYFDDAAGKALLSSKHLGNLRVLDLSGSCGGEEGVRALASSKVIRNLTHLRLAHNSLGAEAICVLAGSPVLARVVDLDLSFNDAGAEGMRALAESPHLSNVTRFLPPSNLGAEGYSALANWPGLSRLRELNLAGTCTDEGPEALADSPHASNLVELSLASACVTAKGVEALARSKSLSGLRSLTLGGNRFGSAGAVALAKGKDLTEVRYLNLSNCDLDDAALVALAKARVQGSVTHLDISANEKIGEKGLRALAGSKTLKHLRELNLGGARVGSAGLAALASPLLVGLRKLNLGSNRVGDEGVRALAESPAAAGLVSLDLGGNGVGVAGAVALAASPYLRSLEYLNLGANHMGDEGAWALASSPNLAGLLTLRVNYTAELSPLMLRQLGGRIPLNNLRSVPPPARLSPRAGEPIRLGPAQEEYVRQLASLLLPGRGNIVRALSHPVSKSADRPDVNFVSFLPDGKRILSASTDGVLCLWDFATGEVLRRWKFGKYPSVVVTDTGRMLAARGSGRDVIVLDLDADREVARFPSGLKELSVTVFSPDGQSLALGDREGGVCVRDVKTGKERCRLAVVEPPLDELDEGAFSPDGRRLAVTGEDERVVLWSRPSGELFRILPKESCRWTNFVAFAPGGRLLASASTDEDEITVWNVETGKQVQRVETKNPFCMVFSPDGRVLALGERSYRTSLWEMATGRLLRRLAVPSECTFSVAFSPDGRHLVSGGDDLIVRVWDIGQLTGS